jgi:hypothetical protein
LLSKLINDLINRKFPLRLQRAMDTKMMELICMHQEGQIKTEDWDEHGAKLAIAWVLRQCANTGWQSTM